jgi:hypothetical protein
MHYHTPSSIKKIQSHTHANTSTALSCVSQYYIISYLISSHHISSHQHLNLLSPSIRQPPPYPFPRTLNKENTSSSSSSHHHGQKKKKITMDQSSNAMQCNAIQFPKPTNSKEQVYGASSSLRVIVDRGYTQKWDTKEKEQVCFHTEKKKKYPSI